MNATAFMPMPLILAFAISVILCPIMIPFLKKLKFGQFVRDDGPQSHLKKAGTPTMGGLIILSAIVLTSLFFIKDYPAIIPVLFMTLGFGLIGFLDDYIKVVMKRSLGLRAWQKMLGQFLVTGIFCYYLMNYTELGTEVLIPFSGGKLLDLGVFFIPFLFVAILGTVNGANFTDGLDGLATSVTILIAVFFAVAAVIKGEDVSVIACIVAGALLGFLLFNVYPARVFMGDTGSLALGGFVAAIAFMMRMPLFILIVAFVYLAEVLSVMLQVGFFKLTGGKRIFKMAPIHHHFELCGWEETRVVAVFSTVTALLCIIALMGI